MEDYKQRVKAKEDEQSELLARWKVDSDLLYLSKYTMKSPDGKHDVPEVINITLNIPGQFASDTISKLGTAKEQVIVETEDKKLDTTEIEDFQKAIFGTANARLRLLRKWELNPYFDFHSCIRGGVAARCVFQIEEGVLVSDIVPWDIRYLTYAVGGQGLDWTGYKTTRTKDDIEAQYHEEMEKRRFTIQGKTAEVLDVWSKEHNEVWITNTKILEQEHDLGYVPVVIEKVTLGSMLADADSLEHEGESIFFLIRGVVPELNRLISIMQSLNFTTLKPPKGWGSRGGQEGPEYKEVMSPASITGHEIGGGVTDITFGDAQRSTQIAYTIMRDAIDKATAASSGLAVIESPPASGVRAMVAGENIDQLLSPRLGVKARMNKGLAEMSTQQVIKIGGSIELGTPGHKRRFQTSKLEGAYETYYKYTIKSQSVDAGRASLAAAYGDDLSWRTKAEEIYQLEDVDGEENQRRWEEAERLSVGVKIYRTIVALKKRADEGDKDAEFEAQLLAGELGVSIDRLLAGEGLPKPQKEDEPTQVLSLFGGQNTRGAGVKKEE